MSAPALSPSRQEDAETVRIAFELGAISQGVRMNLLKKIYKEQRAEDAARMKAKREAALKKRREAAKAARQRFAVSVDFSIPMRKTGKTETFTVSRTVSVEATSSGIAEAVSDAIEVVVEKLSQDSELVVVGELVETGRTEMEIGKPGQAVFTKMKDLGALALDGEEAHDFDSNQGRCVFDWLIKRYGSVRGCKKLATVAGLVELFGENALATGVSPMELNRFCDAVGCRQYALDESHKIIHTYTPEKLNNNVPPLCYRIKNAHIYPIVSEASAICQMGRSTSLAQQKAKAVEEVAELAESLEVVVLETSEMTPVKELVRICRETGVEAYNRHRAPLSFVDGRLASFKLGGRLYMFAEDEMLEAARKVFDLNGYVWNGESIPTMLNGQLKHLGLTERSNFNPHANAALLMAKGRQHYGFTQQPSEDAWAVDICKAYSSCIIKPLAPWLMYDIACEWRPFWGAAADAAATAGLYFVETDDMRLFHGSNIYSNEMLRVALRDGIAFRVLHQYLPSRTLPVTYMDEFAGSVDAACRGDWSLKKLFFNSLVGLLGRTSVKTTTARMDTDVNRVWADYTDQKRGGTPFIIKEDGYYVYGRHRSVELAEHNLPWWIQILDHSNIKLYEIMRAGEATGATMIGRKTDCVIFEGGQPLPEVSGVGGYRPSEVPQMREMVPASVRSLSPSICERDGWTVSPIASSSEVDAAFTAVKRAGGALITGYAGTGKTYLAKQIAGRWRGPVIRMAPTNKAAINMGGRTIHKTLSVDSAGKINLRGLREKYGRQAVLVWLDEISMIGGALWRMLAEVRKALPLAVFVLTGDEGQTKPVGEEDSDYFNSSVVQTLAAGLHINLTQIQRYDLDLAAVALAARNGKAVSLPRRFVAAARHISFLNATRKRINALLNRQEGRFLPYLGDDEKPQDAWIYAGLPIAASRNQSQGGELFAANAERFTVVEVGRCIVAVSQRPEGEHRVEIPFEKFHDGFILDYCATTHSSQGDTIDGPICIHDAERMPRRVFYTALTRAKRLAQITVA